MLTLPRIAQKLRDNFKELQGARKVLVTAPVAFINHVSLYLVCSPIHGGADQVLFLSVDRPNSNLAKLIERHCSEVPKVIFGNAEMDPVRSGGISCVTGLFAPKLMVEAMGKMSVYPAGKSSIVVGNITSLGFYNSNDRIREFLAKLEEKLREDSVLKVVMVMDTSSGYIHSLARDFADKEVDLSG